MRGIIGPALLTIAGALGVTHTETAKSLYLAAYPEDPRLRQAIERCAERIPDFNRLSSSDRAACYAQAELRPGATGEPTDDAARRAHATQRFLVAIQGMLPQPAVAAAAVPQGRSAERVRPTRPGIATVGASPHPLGRASPPLPPRLSP